MNIGDEVTIDCYTSFGESFTTTITDIKTKYDCNTGEPYFVYTIKTGQQFDGRNGDALTSPTMYYMVLPKKEDK